jgi:hypothetical protein
MDLFEFAETADAGDLWKWYQTPFATHEQFTFVNKSGAANRPVLHEPELIEKGYRDNCSPEVARMFFQFVALACNE